MAAAPHVPMDSLRGEKERIKGETLSAAGEGGVQIIQTNCAREPCGESWPPWTLIVVDGERLVLAAAEEKLGTMREEENDERTVFGCAGQAC